MTTIKQLEAAAAAADAAFRQANAALEDLTRRWAEADRLIRTAGYNVDALAVAKSQLTLGVISREAPEVERRVKDTALAKGAAELALHAAQGELQRAQQALERLSNLSSDEAMRYHKNDLQRMEQQAKDSIRRFS